MNGYKFHSEWATWNICPDHENDNSVFDEKRYSVRDKLLLTIYFENFFFLKWAPSLLKLLGQLWNLELEEKKEGIINIYYLD